MSDREIYLRGYRPPIFYPTARIKPPKKPADTKWKILSVKVERDIGEKFEQLAKHCGLTRNALLKRIIIQLINKGGCECE